MKPINPHQSGITGFNPGIATSSLADGGGRVDWVKDGSDEC